MKDNNHIYNEKELKLLAESYFNGSLSPHEIEKLRHGAALLDEGKLSIHDSQLINDLRMIQALEAYSSAYLVAAEELAPPSLETRLDAHISALAASSRRRWVWIKAGCAAACAALLVTGAIRLGIPSGSENLSLSKADTIPTQTSPRATQTPEAPAGQPLLAEVSILKTTGEGEPEETDKKKTTVRNLTVESSAAAKKAPVITMPLTEAIALSSMPGVTASVNVPASMNGLPAVLPTLLSATTEVVDMAVSPLEKLSLSFENIMESLNFVNGVIYEAHQTASSLSEDIILASASPIQ